MRRYLLPATFLGLVGLVVGTAVWTYWPRSTGPHFRPGPSGKAGPLPPAEVTLRPEHRYNVVLIVVDTLRADHLSGWGYPRPTSPMIDRLAAGGLRFSQGTSQASWTTASIASLMTSQYADSLGIQAEGQGVPEEATTLAEVLRSAGLRTGAVVSHAFCSDEYNFDQGFESFDTSNILGHVGVSSPGVTAKAEAFVDAHQAEPFFLWVHYFDPHFAYTMHDGYDFDPESTYAGPVRSELRYADLARLTLGDADLRELDRLYDSEIGFTDHWIGELLAHLEELGLSDHTLVMLTGDHGEEFLDHGRLGHAKTVYQEVVHVPLVVDCPGWDPAVVDVPVANVDVMPTVLACLGLPPLTGLAGTALGPTLPAPRTVFTETAKRNNVLGGRSGDLKVVGNRKLGFQLYDLALDPGETTDLAASDRADLDRLTDEVLAWRARLRSAGTLAAPVVETSDEERAQLEALGYTEQ